MLSPESHVEPPSDTTKKERNGIPSEVNSLPAKDISSSKSGFPLDGDKENLNIDNKQPENYDSKLEFSPRKIETSVEKSQEALSLSEKGEMANGTDFERRRNHMRKDYTTSYKDPSWKKTKKKKFRNEEVEPLNDLTSWPTLEQAIKEPKEKPEKKDKKPSASSPEIPERDLKESQETSSTPSIPLISSTSSASSIGEKVSDETTSPSASKKKGVNWVPFKDIEPVIPRPFNSRGRNSGRRGGLGAAGGERGRDSRGDPKFRSNNFRSKRGEIDPDCEIQVEN